MAETAANPNTVLRITDDVTGRRSTMRIDPDDAALPLRDLLDLYLERPDVERLSCEGRITEASAEMLASIQDVVYACDDLGRLRGLYGGVEFAQGPRAVSLDYPLRPSRIRADGRDVVLLDLSVDRTSVGYDRNWTGFSKRRWDRGADFYAAFVADAARRAYGGPRSEDILASEDAADRVRLLEALARRIWESDFESCSRFTGRKLAYKWGDETVRNIADGAGGICSEKVQALKFLTDHLGFDSEYVIAGPNVPDPVPEDRLRELLTTFDFRFSKRHMRYWQHTALLYRIDGESVLVDDTNGNIPFLFLKGAEADRLLGYDDKPAVPVRMAIQRESFYYHRVSQDIVHDLLFAMEGWIPYVDLVQVFDNELGLYISSDFMVTAVVFRDERGFEKTSGEYRAACRRAGRPCDVSPRWDLGSPLGEAFAAAHPTVAERVLDAREHLLARYDECHGADHEAGLVVIGLDNSRPRAAPTRRSA